MKGLKKRSISMLLCLIMMLQMLPLNSVAFAEETVTNTIAEGTQPGENTAPEGSENKEIEKPEGSTAPITEGEEQQETPKENKAVQNEQQGSLFSFASEPAPQADGDEPEHIIMVNGNPTYRGEVTIGYDEQMTMSMTNPPTVSVQYLDIARSTAEEGGPYENLDDNAQCRLEPGDYYLGYYYVIGGVSYTAPAKTFKLKVEKSQVAAPDNIIWDGSTVTWNAVTKTASGYDLNWRIDKYEIIVLKNNEEVSKGEVDYQEDVTPSFAFASSGVGVYEFRIKTVNGWSTYYYDSEVSTKKYTLPEITMKKDVGVDSVSPSGTFVLGFGETKDIIANINSASPYEFTNWTVSPDNAVTFADAASASTTVSFNPNYSGDINVTITANSRDKTPPEIKSFSGDNTDTLTAVAVDNESGITAYAFDKNSTAGEETEWTSVGETPVKGEKPFTYIMSDGGDYYFHVKDKDGNISNYNSAVSVTKVTFNHNDANENPTVSYGYVTNKETYELTTPTRGGYTFDGWYTAAEGGTKVERFADEITTELYAHWKSEALSVKINGNDPTAEGTYAFTETYKGENYTLTISNSSTVTGNVSYSWVDKDNILHEGDSISVKNHADSGGYKAKAVLKDNKGIILDEKEITVTVTIEKYPLTVTALADGEQHSSIVFGSAVPNYSISHTPFVGEDEGKEDKDIFGISGKVTSAYTITSPVSGEGKSIPVTASGYEADNYVVTSYVDGTLKVLAKTIIYTVCTLEEGTFVYNGKEQKPTVTVKTTDGAGKEITLENRKDYTVEYQNNINATTEDSLAHAIITLQGNYSGSVELPFGIEKATPNLSAVLQHEGEAEWVYDNTEKTYTIDTDLPETEEATVKIEYAKVPEQTEEGETPEYSFSSVQPVDAGSYVIRAVYEGSRNYNAVISDPTGFTINKRDIVLVSKSQTWEYDGAEHSYDATEELYECILGQEYTVTVIIDDENTPNKFEVVELPEPKTVRNLGFAAKNGINSAVLDGRAKITNVGEEYNIIILKSTTETKAENYNRYIIPGILKITPATLLVPRNAAWSVAAPGTALWTSVKRDNLEVSYEVQLYAKDAVGNYTQVGAKQTVTATESGAVSCDFSAAINDYVNNLDETDAIPTFSFTVKAIPTGGNAKDNYLPSKESGKAGNLAVAVVSYTEQDFADADTLTVKGNVSKSGSFILMQGGRAEFAPVFADNATAVYEFNPPLAEGGAISLKQTDDDGVLSYAARENESSSRLSVTVKKQPAVPEITAFTPTHTEEGGVSIAIEAKDYYGISQYAITTEAAAPEEGSEYWKEVKASEQSGETGSRIFNTTVTFTTDDILGEESSTTLYLHVKNTNGKTASSVASSSAAADVHSEPITLYKITFAGNGAAQPDVDVSGSMPAILKIKGATLTLPANGFSANGYYFHHWFEQGSSANAAAQYPDHGSYTKDQANTLVAYWEKSDYNYKLQHDFPNLPGEKESVVYFANYNDEINLSDTDLHISKEGYQYDRDATLEANPGAIGVTEGDDPRPVKVTITESDKTYVIKYKPTPYTITFNVTLPEAGVTMNDITWNTGTAPKGAEIKNGVLTWSVPHAYGDTINNNEYMVVPSLNGYAFLGWNFGIYPTRPSTMPSMDMIVTSSFLAANAEYVIRVWQQDLMANPDTTKAYPYNYIGANQYTMTEEITVAGVQGMSIEYDELNVLDPIGFNKYGYIFQNASTPLIDNHPENHGLIRAETAGTAVTPDDGEGDTPTPQKPSFVVDNGKTYINVYYTRTTDNIIVRKVWQGNVGIGAVGNYELDVTANQTWPNVTFGIPIAKDGTTERPDYVNFLAADNKDASGKKVCETWPVPAGYELYQQALWSTNNGSAPDTMPNGTLVVNRQFVKFTMGKFIVNVWIENETYDDYTCNSFEYMGYVGQYAYVGLDHATANYNPDGESIIEDMSYVNYGDYARAFDYFVVGDSNPNNNTYILKEVTQADIDAEKVTTSGTKALQCSLYQAVITDTEVHHEAPVELNIFLERNSLPVKLRYYYNDGTLNDPVEFASVTKMVKWSNNLNSTNRRYNIEPLRYFWGSSSPDFVDNPWNGNTPTTALTIEKATEMANYNFCTNNYVVSYKFRYDRTMGHLDTEDSVSVAKRTSMQKDGYTMVRVPNVANSPVLSYQAISDEVYIYYNKVIPEKQYYLDVYYARGGWNGNKVTPLRGLDDTETRQPLTIELGEGENKHTYNIRVANAALIFADYSSETLMNPGSFTTYPGLALYTNSKNSAAAHYNYTVDDAKAVENGFTVQTVGSKKVYTLGDYAYVPDPSDIFYLGHIGQYTYNNGKPGYNEAVTAALDSYKQNPEILKKYPTARGAYVSNNTFGETVIQDVTDMSPSPAGDLLKQMYEQHGRELYYKELTITMANTGNSKIIYMLDGQRCYHYIRNNSLIKVKEDDTVSVTDIPGEVTYEYHISTLGAENGEWVKFGCTHYEKRDNYTLKWFEDEACTKEVTESFLLDSKGKTVYGKYVQDQINNRAIAVYGGTDGRYHYLLEDIAGFIDGTKTPPDDFGISDPVKIFEKYIDANDNKAEKTTEVDLIRYTIGGEIIAAQALIPGYTSHDATMDPANYALVGFEYDMTMPNIVKTFVSEGTGTLISYYKRSEYTLTVDPMEADNKTDVTKSTVRFGQTVELAPESKTGYDFAGWKFYSADKSIPETPEGSTETPEAAYDPTTEITDQVSYVLAENKTATFKVPAGDVWAVAQYVPHQFDLVIYHYFQNPPPALNFTRSDAFTRDGYTNGNTVTMKFEYSDIERECKKNPNGDGYSYIYETEVNEDGENVHKKYVLYYAKNGALQPSNNILAPEDLVCIVEVVTLTQDHEYHYKNYNALSDTELNSLSPGAVAGGNLLEDYLYSDAVRTYKEENEHYTGNDPDQTFIAKEGMTLECSYTLRKDVNVKFNVIATDGGSVTNAATFTGAGTYVYGDDVKLKATATDGYRIVGPDPETEIVDPANGPYIPANGAIYLLSQLDNVQLDEEGNAVRIDDTKPISVKAGEMPVNHFIAKFSGNNYVLVEPNPVATPITEITVPGTASGEGEISALIYRSYKNQSVLFKAELPEGADSANYIKNYTWKITKPDGTVLQEVTDSPVHSYTLPSDLTVGTYTATCSVTVARKDNGREETFTMTTQSFKIEPQPLVVTPVDYDDVYDGAAHNIRLTFPASAPAGGKIYYAFEELTAENIAAKIESGAAIEGGTPNPGKTVKLNGAITDVVVDNITDRNPVAQTVYYYVVPADAKNYAAASGSATVKISPKNLELVGKGAFTKVYNGKAEVTGDDLDRLMNNNDQSLYDIKGWVGDDAVADFAKNTYVLDCEAKMNSAHVADASNVALSQLDIRYKLDLPEDHPNYEMRGKANYNYAFSDQIINLAAQITPKPVPVVWDSVNSFVYDGAQHAPTAALTTSEFIAGEGDKFEVAVLGKQTAVNENDSYTARAVLTVKSGCEGQVFASDYSLTNATKSYTITQKPVTIKAEERSVIYDGKPHTLTSFVFVADATTTQIEADALNAKYSIVAVCNDTYKDAGTYSTIKPNTATATIREREGGMDRTSNFDIAAAQSTLTIDPRPIKLVEGIAANNKTYDGTDTAALKLDSVQIFAYGEGDDASKPAIIEGDDVGINEDAMNAAITGTFQANSDKILGKDVYIKEIQTTIPGELKPVYDSDGNEVLDADGNPVLESEQINVTEYEVSDKTVSIAYSTATDAEGNVISLLAGAAAANYTLVAAKCQTETTAKITKAEITITANDRTTPYGTLAEAFNYAFAGPVEGENSFETAKISVDTESTDVSYTVIKDDSVIDYNALTPAGVYSINPSGITSLNNYTVSYLPGILTINAKKISVTGSLIEKIYDGNTNANVTDSKLTVTGLEAGVSIADVINIGSGSYSTANVHESNDSVTVTLTIRSTEEGNNYTFADGATTLTIKMPGKITPATMTITPKHDRIVYGTAKPEPSSYTADVSGVYVTPNLKNTVLEALTYNCDYDDTVADKRNARDYPITASGYGEEVTLPGGTKKLQKGNYYIEYKTGKLKVDKAVLTVTPVLNDGEQNISVVYKQNLPAVTGYTYTGFKYSDEDKTNIGLVIPNTGTEQAATNAAHQGDIVTDKKGEYNFFTTDTNQYTSTNYTFETGYAKFNVVENKIVIKGITVAPKVYDGNYNVKADSIYYGSYFSEAVNGVPANEIYTVSAVYAKADGTPTKNVTEAATAKLTIALTTAYAGKLEIVRAAEINGVTVSGGQMTDDTVVSSITARPVKITANSITGDNSVVYGTTSLPTYKATYEGLVAGETAHETEGLSFKGEDGTSAPYSGTTEFTKVGDHPIKVSGFGNGMADVSNYAPSYFDGTLTVKAARFTTPTVKWANNNTGAWGDTAPGTVEWTCPARIGDVPVHHFVVELYKDDVKIDDATVVTENATVLSHDFGAKIRANGAGKYTVNVTAVAPTIDENAKNAATDNENLNVTSSDAGTSGELLAAKVTWNETVKAYSPSQNRTLDKEGVLTEKKINNTPDTYVIINGETLPVSGELVNATGYRVTSVTAKNANSLTVNVAEQTAPGKTFSGDITATLQNTDEIKLTLNVSMTPAVLSTEIARIDVGTAGGNYEVDADGHWRLYYGTYDSDHDAEYRITASHPNDVLPTGGYSYSYKWGFYLNDSSYQKYDDEKSSTEKTDEWKFWTGQVAANYTLRCIVTATRNDNGETVKLADKWNDPSYSAPVTVLKGKVFAETLMNGWTYGGEVQSPSINPDNTIPIDWADHDSFYTPNYYYTLKTNENLEKSSANMTDAADYSKWSKVKPHDPGEYIVFAAIDASNNYAQFNTANKPFTINKPKLDAPQNLQNSASTTAPYGQISWDAVTSSSFNGNTYGLEENNGVNPESVVTPKYLVKVYKNDGAEPIYREETAKTQLDITSQIQSSGIYRISVTALAYSGTGDTARADGQKRCEDSDEESVIQVTVVLSEIEIYDNGVKQDGHALENRTYDGNDVTVKAVLSGQTANKYKWYKDDAELEDDDPRVNGDTLTLLNVADSGSYSCVITTQSGQTEYTPIATVEIIKRVVDLSSHDHTKEYDGTELKVDESDITVTPTTGWANGAHGQEGADYSGFVGITDITNENIKDDNNGKVTNTFDYTLYDGTVYGKPKTLADNYTITQHYGTLTITPRDLNTKTADKFDIAIYETSETDESRTIDDKTYKGSAYNAIAPAAVIDNGLNAGADDARKKLNRAGFVDYTLSYGANKNAGENAGTVTLTGQFNYKGTVEIPFTILPKQITVKADPKTKVYGEADPANTFVATGMVPGESQTLLNITFTREEGEDVRAENYVITPQSGTGSNVQGNYEITAYNTDKLTITKRPITLTSGDAGRKYNGEALTKETVTATPKATGEGFAYDDAEAVVYTNFASITNYNDTGAVDGKINNTFIAQNKDESKDVLKNYTVTYVYGTLTIEKRNVTITSGDASQTYNGQSLSNTSAPTVSGDLFVAGEGITASNFASITNVAETHAGNNTYAYTFNSNTREANYIITQKEGTLTITPASAKVTVDENQQSVYGDPYHELTATVSGTFGSDTIAYTLTRETTVYEFDPAGKYAITATGAAVQGNGNYNVSFVNGTYTITQREISFVVGDITNAVYTGSEQTGAAAPAAPTAGNLAENDTVTVSYEPAKGVAQGTYTGSFAEQNAVVIKNSSDVDVTTSYNISTTPGTLVISKFAGNWDKLVDLADYTVTYNGQEQSADNKVSIVENSEVGAKVTGTVSYQYSFDKTTWYDSIADLKQTDVNTADAKGYKVYVKAASSDFAKPAYAEAYFKINPAEITVSIRGEQIEKTYDGTTYTAHATDYAITDKTGEAVSFFKNTTVALKETAVDKRASATNVSDCTTDGKKMLGLVPGDFTCSDTNYTVTFIVEDGWVKINPAQVTVSITGPQVEMPYDGTTYTSAAANYAKTASGTALDHFDIDNVVRLKSESADKSVSATNVSECTDAGGKLLLHLAVGDFECTDTNYDVTFNIVEDGWVKITPAAVTVSIKGQQVSATYDGNAHTARSENFEITSVTGQANEKFDNSTVSVADKSVSATNVSDCTDEGGKLLLHLAVGDFTCSDTNYAVTFNIEEDGWVRIDKRSIAIEDEIIISGITDHETYTGSAIEQNGMVLTDNGVKDKQGVELVKGEDKDYTVSYSSNVNVGTVTITIAGVGNYKDTRTTTFEIVPKEMTFTVASVADKPYNGNSQAAKPEVKDGTTVLSENTDFEYSYKNAAGEIISADEVKNAGSYTVVVTGKGNYLGSTGSTTYAITKIEIELTSGSDNKVYDGTELTAHSYTVTKGSFIGSEKDGIVIDYTGSITNYTDAANNTKNNSFAVSASSTTNTDNYAFSYVNGVLNVTQRPVTFAVENVSKTYTGETVYGNSYPNADKTPTTGTLANGQEAQFNYTPAKGVEVNGGTPYNNGAFSAVKIVIPAAEGSEEIDVTGNYDIKTTKGTLTITQSDADWTDKITFNGAEYTYNGEAHGITSPATSTATGETSYQYRIENGSWNSDLSSLTRVNAGSYPVEVQATNPNYSKPANVTVTLLIHKRPVSFVGKSETKQYTGDYIVINKLEDPYDDPNDGKEIGLLKDDTHNVVFTAKGKDISPEPYVGTITDKDAVIIKKGNVDVTANYSITTTPGALTIIQKSATWKIEMDSPSAVMFDGYDHGFKKNDGSYILPTTDAVGESTYYYSFTEFPASVTTKEELDALVEEGKASNNIADMTKVTANESGYPLYIVGYNPNYSQLARPTVNPTLVINRLPIDDTSLVTITLGEELFYNGEEQTKTYTISIPSLKPGTSMDIAVSGDKHTDVASYTITFTGENPNFKNTVNLPYKIHHREIVPDPTDPNGYKYGKGKIIVVVEDKDSIGAKLTTDDLTIIKDTVSNEELFLIEYDENGLIKIVIPVKNITDTIDTDYPGLRKDFLDRSPGYSEGMYVDITMFKYVNNDPPVQIKEVAHPVGLSFNAISSIINTNLSYIRSYIVDRHHGEYPGGEFELIPESYENGVVSISTDKFSEYAILYKDTRKPDNGNGWSPKTGDRSSLGLYLGMMLMSVMGMGVTAVGGKRKKQYSGK